MTLYVTLDLDKKGKKGEVSTKNRRKKVVWYSTRRIRRESFSALYKRRSCKKGSDQAQPRFPFPYLRNPTSIILTHYQLILVL